MGAISIVRPGLFTTIQDLGRWGFQARGVSVSGAMDRYSHRLANRVVGNPDDEATLEVTLTGPHLRFEEAAVCAVTGAEFELAVDDAPVEMSRPIAVAAGAMLRFGPRRRGARAYIAVRGGIDVAPVLGSRSTHVLTGLGGFQGRALRAGDRLTSRSLTPSASPAGSRGRLPLPDGGARVRVIAGDAQLTGDLEKRRFRLSHQSNRIGYRLEGEKAWTAATGIISTAVPAGVIQVPPSGEPILLMADCATTGGYAIAATVITADLGVAGQLAPGDWIEFEVCDLDLADAAWQAQEAALGPA